MTTDARTIIGTAANSVSFEGLEGRQLMSAVAFGKNTLAINGTNKSDDIRVMLSNDGKTLSAKVNNGATQSFAASNVWTVKVNTGEGNDKVTFDSRITAAGDIVSSNGNDTIITGAGNDKVRTAGGNDVVSSGAGNDYVETASGDDRLDLGAGNDMGIAGDGRDTILAGLGKDGVKAGSGDDSITASSEDSINGGTGKNTITRSSTGGATGGTTKGETNGGTTSGGSSSTTQKTSVRKLSLINADTGAVISGYGTLTNGMTLDLSKLPKNITIIAETNGKVESAKFDLSDNSAGRVDDSSSYSLTESKSGKYGAWTPSSTSTVKLSVTPYGADQAKGAAGTTTTLTLNIKRATPSTDNSTPIPTPTPNPTPTASQTGAPKIRINTIQTTVIAGQAFMAEAAGTLVPSHHAEDATFHWNFGDPTGRFNELPGFNAAHVYERPGSYTAKLTVTSPSGQSSTATVKVNVIAANYDTIYVAKSGSDSNNGQSQGQAVRTLAKAVSIAGGNAQILLKRGDTFEMNNRVDIKNDNVVISSYGSGSNPTLFFTGGLNTQTMISVNDSAHNVTIQGLTFNSVYSTDGNSAGMPHAISAGGTSVTVRDNIFLNVGYGVNANQQPKGLLVMDNKVPLAGGLRSYFVWGQGSDLTIVGNTVANSTREHIVRLGGADRVNIAFNNFSNLDRRNSGDKGDTAKGAVVVQRGSFAYVSYNTLRGPVGVGPLGGADGLKNKHERFSHAVFEGNTLHGETLDVHHGASNVTIRGNTSYVDNAEGIKIEGYSNSFGRGVVDVVIDRNVVVNKGEAGNFLLVQGPVKGITLTGNAYVAPNLKAGGGGAAAIYVADSTLNSFNSIDNNLWPSASRGSGWARGGIAFLGTSYTSANHRTPSEWNSMSKVGDDKFSDVSLKDAGSYSMKITSAATQTALRKAA